MLDTKPGINNSVVILGLITGVILILLSKIGVFNPVYPAFKELFSGWQSQNLVFFQKVGSDLAFLADISTLRDQNEQLRGESEKLLAENSRLKIEIADLQKITKQLSYNLTFRQEPVRVIKFSDTQTEIIISKGGEHQIKTGDVAILDNNYIGIVTDVAATFAKVRLSTDSRSKIPALVQEGSSKGLLIGDNSSLMLLKEVPNDRVIASGMLLISAGTDGVIPYGLVLGRLEAVDSQATEINQTATVRSLLRFNELSEIFIIIK